MALKDLSVVVPSRNGLKLLKAYLPGILAETRRADGEVIVVDDCSDDNTAKELTSLFPDVTVISRKGVPGFCYAVNLGMSRAEGRSLMLLNNDTVPARGSFTALMGELDNADPDVAVVVPVITRPDGSDDSSFSWKFSRGLAVTGENLGGEEYPSGACALWKRNVWESLGGLSTRYAPIYWEDVDMGVRMHRAGYRMKRCPDVVVKHMHAATMGSSAPSEILRERNRLIFMQYNCNSLLQRISALLWLPFHITRAYMTGNLPFTAGFFEYLQWKRAQR